MKEVHISIPQPPSQGPHEGKHDAHGPEGTPTGVRYDVAQDLHARAHNRGKGRWHSRLKIQSIGVRPKPKRVSGGEAERAQHKPTELHQRSVCTVPHTRNARY